MSKNKTENAVIKSLILLHLSKKLLRYEKVQKLKWCFPDEEGIDCIHINIFVILQNLFIMLCLFSESDQLKLPQHYSLHYLIT